jgi:outer membrane protein OmpA-like peptidoglycan-associated protein
MQHAVVHEPPTLGARTIIRALLKLAGLAILLTAILASPAWGQELAVRTWTPLLLESDPVAIMGLETKRARRDSASRSDSIASQRTPRLAADRDTAGLRDGVDATIYFDVGSSKVRSDASVTLGETLVLLRSLSALRIRIEGQADVPGSTAYDIALAWDRARAAKVWLTNHGMDPDRVDAVGYSEGLPLCGTRVTACSLGIRRDEFLLVAGGDHVKRASP